jgi:hypothetical protein
LIWGEECFVGDDAPHALVARIATEAARLAASPWLGLGPVASGLRWAPLVSGATARETLRRLDDRHGGPRAPAGPFLVARVLAAPRDPARARRDRADRHAPRRGLKPGHRIGLVLQDWYFRPAGTPHEPDILLPHFVLAPSGSDDPGRWVLEIAGAFVLEDRWILAPGAVDVEPERIGWSGSLEPWNIARGFDLPEEGGPFGAAPLRHVGTADRMAPDAGGAKGGSIRMKTAKYYLCPHCRNRTRVVPARLAPDADGRTRPSVLPRALAERLEAFHRVPYQAFDFRCARCDRPVRILYEWSEAGMGGPWHPVVTGFVETT